MSEILLNLNNIRLEISFKSLDELRSILSFYNRNNLHKINIPCKNSLKKDFLLNSIKISREEFPDIEVIPHFSILHEFKKNRRNTEDSFFRFIEFVKSLGCKEVLLVSGSQKRSTLDSVKLLNYFKDNPLFFDTEFSIGVAFNPYLPIPLFDQEVIRLENKLKSGLVSSIWFQFGTDYKLLRSRIDRVNNIISSTKKNYPNFSNIMLFGSILIPSKQFLSRFKYRPWKGVYCAREFLDSVEFADNIIKKLLITYKQNGILPIIETSISSEDHLKKLKNILTL